MPITVEKLSAAELEARGVENWPIWTKETSVFDWEYDSREQCYFLAGRVSVQCADGTVAEFGQGDFVTFPKGLRCTWTVHEDVRKHYQFD
jgi:uncharacterized protein